MAQSVAERYASVFVEKPSRVRQERDAVLADAARITGRAGCPWCEEIGEAHLHGATLYEEGRPLF
jgi:hypothetical protein